MSFGSKSWSNWVIEDKQRVFSILKHCYDRGLRTFDTADFYSNGLSERLVGEFLRHYNIKRETVVILTKIYFPVDETLSMTHARNFSPEQELALVNQRGLSRKHIIAGVQGSVERLGTYVRYIGASSMLATEFAELQFTAERHNWVKFVSSQTCYNLLYREDERELYPFARRHGVALIPWSPLARGILSRPLGGTSERERTDGVMKRFGYSTLEPNEQQIVRRVEELAAKKGVSMATVGLAWVLHKGCYPISGFSSEERVDEALHALDLELSPEEMQYLEEPYCARDLVG